MLSNIKPKKAFTSPDVAHLYRLLLKTGLYQFYGTWLALPVIQSETQQPRWQQSSLNLRKFAVKREFGVTSTS
jgi:hypothetical protein